MLYVFFINQRAINSAGECYLHTVEVSSSNLLSPIPPDFLLFFQTFNPRNSTHKDIETDQGQARCQNVKHPVGNLPSESG